MTENTESKVLIDTETATEGPFSVEGNSKSEPINDAQAAGQKSTLLINDYQKTLIKQWDKTHTTPAPIRDRGDGVAEWLNRKQRKTLDSIQRRANKHNHRLPQPAQGLEVKDESTTPTTDKPAS